MSDKLWHNPYAEYIGDSSDESVEPEYDLVEEAGKFRDCERDDLLRLIEKSKTTPGLINWTGPIITNARLQMIENRKTLTAITFMNGFQEEPRRYEKGVVSLLHNDVTGTKAHLVGKYPVRTPLSQLCAYFPHPDGIFRGTEAFEVDVHSQYWQDQKVYKLTEKKFAVALFIDYDLEIHTFPVWTYRIL